MNELKTNNFKWKPIKDINDIPRGYEIMVCKPTTNDLSGHCQYIYRDDDKWYYVYCRREVSERRLDSFKFYFIPEPIKLTK